MTAYDFYVKCAKDPERTLRYDQGSIIKILNLWELWGDFDIDFGAQEKYDVCSDEQIEWLKSVEIVIDDCFNEFFKCMARRPYYRLRGESVTEEQAFEIIRRIDRFFDVFFYKSSNSDFIGSINFDIRWLSRSSFAQKSGWVRPDGLVGINDITQKYPTLMEFLEEWLRNLYHFPFLNLVIGVTDWDENKHTEYDKFTGKYVDVPYESDTFIEYTEFEESIEIGIWVHDRKIEFMSPVRAAKVYREYEKKYSVHDKRIYISTYNDKYAPDIITIDYLKRCLNSYGIEPN